VPLCNCLIVLSYQLSYSLTVLSYQHPYVLSTITLGQAEERHRQRGQGELHTEQALYRDKLRACFSGRAGDPAERLRCRRVDRGEAWAAEETNLPAHPLPGCMGDQGVLRQPPLRPRTHPSTAQPRHQPGAALCALSHGSLEATSSVREDAEEPVRFQQRRRHLENRVQESRRQGRDGGF